METRLSLNTVMVRDQDQVMRAAITKPMERDLDSGVVLVTVMGMVKGMEMVKDMEMEAARDTNFNR